MQNKDSLSNTYSKVMRGKFGRRKSVRAIQTTSRKMTFGPEIRRLRASVSIGDVASSRCLRKMENIIVKKHDLEAAKYVQRCYRGRLGRRFMKVLREQRMNRIRRVVMPIVLRANSSTPQPGYFSGEKGVRQTSDRATSAGASADSQRTRREPLHTRRRRRSSTRDVLVQPRSTMVSLRTMVSKFASENQIELPENMRDAPMLPPINGAVRLGSDGTLQSQFRASSASASALQPRPGYAWG